MFLGVSQTSVHLPQQPASVWLRKQHWFYHSTLRAKVPLCIQSTGTPVQRLLVFKAVRPRQPVSPPNPPETLILVHLINVTDCALGKSGPWFWSNEAKRLLAHECEKSECPLTLSHFCLRSSRRLQGALWHLILCQKWIPILFRWRLSLCGRICVSLCLLVVSVSPCSWRLWCRRF